MSDPHTDLTALRAALRADVGGLAEALLGPRNEAASTRNTWRWGSKGSLALEVQGARKGLWYSHEGQAGNDPLGLIRHARGGTFPETLKYARKWAGFPEPADDAQDERREQQDADRQARRAQQEAAAAAELAADQAERAEKVARAQQIAAGGVPVPGTPGEYYLKQVRGIAPPARGWPTSILWHPERRALLAVATRADGTVQAVQRIHLVADGSSKIDAEELERRHLPAVKLTNGVQDGAAARLPGDPAGPLLLAEGPETALAAYTSTGHETWIALGGVGKLSPPPGRRIAVMADDDPPEHDARRGQAARALRKAVQGWQRAGLDVVVVRPWAARRRDKSDMADVILQHGQDAVRARIAAALEPSRTAPRRVPVVEARRRVAAAVGGFFERVDAASARRAELNDTAAEIGPDTFTHGVRVSTGVGKSAVARYRIAVTLAAMRERGDGRTMVLAVPTHALGDEQAQAFMELPQARAAGLTAAIWRGRGAPDPRHPDYRNPLVPPDHKTPMCGDLERVRDAQSVGLSAQTAVCKRRTRQPDGTMATVTCPLFARCSYQKQSERRADLWITSHDMLFHEKPAVIGDVAAVVVDEAAWRKGLIGAEGRPLALPLDALAENCGVVSVTTGAPSSPLHTLRHRLLDALRAVPDGPVRRDALDGAMLTPDSAAEAIKLEWARKVDPLHPGQTRQERKEALARAQGNRAIARLAMAWNAVRELLTPGGPDASGWLALGVEDTRHGPVRMLHLKGRSKVTDGWKAPTLLLDALLPVELVRPFWPDVELVADVQATMPHQRVRQVVDRAYALSMLEPLAEEAAKQDSERAKRRTNRLRDLRAILFREARRHAPGQVLVVLQQGVETALLAMGRLPPNVETAHHNNIAGRDEWKGVRALVVVGRTMPPPAGAERIAEALTGRATAAPMAWYERADAVREMADGSTVPAEADRHTDPVAELVRWQIAEGEVVQIIGRPRGVNRTAADPVDVLVLTDVPLPMPLAGTLHAAELEPGTVDHMLAAGGVAFGCPRHASAAYPLLWGTENAAMAAFKREKLESNPYRESSIRERLQLPRVAYQPAGQGKRKVEALFDPLLCPDPAEFLTERIGKLAWCRVADVSPTEEPDGEAACPSRRASAEPQPDDGPPIGSPPPIPDAPPPAVCIGPGCASSTRVLSGGNGQAPRCIAMPGTSSTVVKRCHSVDVIASTLNYKVKGRVIFGRLQ